MKSVLISIRPQWVAKIVSGEKTIEVRKTAPKDVPFKAYIYATRPKKFYKCGAVSTSDELLWLANGKVEMGDGFKFWANGDEYQCLNGRIIGEFICDKVYPIKNKGSSFVVANEKQSVTNEIAGQSYLYYDDMVSYFGDKDGYGWHISDLKIYDKPRELSEFFVRKFDNRDYCSGCVHHETPITEYPCNDCRRDAFERQYLYRPPQSWQYVEEL